MQLKSATAIIGLAVSASVARADTGWSVDAGLIRTDNATLVTTDQVNDTVESVGGTVAWELQRSRLKAALDGGVGLLHYLHDTYNDDVLGQASGNAVLQVLPERLSLTLTDNWGQIAADPFAPETPQNRQHVNVLTAGPDYHLRLNDQTRLELGARYNDTRFQDATQIDTHSWGGSVGLLHEMSQASSLGVFVSQNRYAYHSLSGINAPLYDQQAAWVTWQSITPRQTLDAELGVNRIRSAGESQSRPKASVTWQRRIRPSWLFNLHLAAEYQNAGQQFAAGNASNIGITSQPATVDKGDLAFVFERPRTKFSIGFGVGKVNYIGTDQLDEKTWFADVTFSRRFTPHVQGFLSYRIDRRDYETGVVRLIRQEVGTAGLDWGLGKSVFLTLGYSRTDSEGNTAQFQYLNNLLSLRLSWRGGAATAPRTFGF